MLIVASSNSYVSMKNNSLNTRFLYRPPAVGSFGLCSLQYCLRAEDPLVKLSILAYDGDNMCELLTIHPRYTAVI